MKKQLYLCVDIETQMKQEDLQVMTARKGTLFREREDRFTFIEKGAYARTVHPELHWHVLDRTKNGKVSVNANHTKLELYIPHEDYRSGRELADILASQVEQMGDNLCETDMTAVIQSIRALRKEATC